MLPVTLTIGLVNVNFLVDTLFASRLLDPELAPAAIDKAFRLYMLPQGVFAVAVTTVLFPTLARLAARDDIAGLRRALDGGMRQIAFLLVPAALISIVLARSRSCELVYQRGEFTAEDTVIVAQCLQAFSIGLVFNGWMLILNRSFYAVQTNWVPTGIALGAVGLNARVRHGLLPSRNLGHPARDLDRERRRVVRPARDDAPPRRARARRPDARRRRPGRHRGGRCGRPLPTAPGDCLDAALGDGLVAQLLSLGAGFAAAGLVYVGLARALGLRELEALLLLRAR